MIKNINKSFFFIGLFFSNLVLNGQIIKLSQNNADLSGAIKIESSEISTLSAPIGYGPTQEISSPKPNPKSIEKEHNTVWYKISPKKSCILSFDLIPDSENDDYDFMLFEAKKENPNSVDDLKIIRTNIARNNKKIGKLTGLKKGELNEFVAQGPNPTYSKAVFVDSTKTYYLLVDNVYENGKGHSIKFYYSDCVETQKKNHTFSLNLNIFDDSTKTAVAADIYIVDKSKDIGNYDTSHFKSASSILYKIDTMQFYEIIVISDNYLVYKDIIKSYGTDKVYRKDIYLTPIYEGSSLMFDDIYFQGGNDIITANSRPALNRLLKIMKDNPSLIIEIQGHVNQPLNRKKTYDDAYYMNLSTKRSEAVFNYLAKRGISESRMSFQGFGNSKMLYPYAVDSDQMQKNRRVEILIISF